MNTVDDGGIGYLAEGIVNLPLNDRTAVRLVGWHRHDAGYIDNVYRERTFPTSGITANNADFVEDNYNDADTYGARAALQLDLNDNWTITPQVMAQKQETNGSCAYDTTVGDLKIAHGRPGDLGRPLGAGRAHRRRQDREPRPGLRGLVPQARRRHRVGLFRLLVLVRHTATATAPTGTTTTACRSTRRSTSRARTATTATRTNCASRRMREQRFRFVAGAFLQRQEHDIQQRYKIDGLGAQISVTGWDDTLWLTKQLRVDEDFAVFGEFTFDFTDKLTGTDRRALLRFRQFARGLLRLQRGLQRPHGRGGLPGWRPHHGAGFQGRALQGLRQDNARKMASRRA